MIEFLELHACLVRIKGRHALKWGTCSNSNTEQYTVARQRTSVGFKLAVRDDSGAGGGSCQIYGSTVQLVGGVVTSHLVDLELIHAAEACTPADHML